MRIQRRRSQCRRGGPPSRLDPLPKSSVGPTATEGVHGPAGCPDRCRSFRWDQRRSPTGGRLWEPDDPAPSSLAPRLRHGLGKRRARARHPRSSIPKKASATATKAAAVPWPATTRRTMPTVTQAIHTTTPVGTMAIGRRHARTVVQPATAPTRNGHDVLATPATVTPSAWEERPMTTKTRTQTTSRAPATTRCTARSVGAGAEPAATTRADSPRAPLGWRPTCAATGDAWPPSGPAHRGETANPPQPTPGWPSPG